MMQANELRIGNILLYNGKLSRVTAIDLDLDDEGVPLVSFEDSNPVELNYGKVERVILTPEILEKCGFNRQLYKGNGIIYRLLKGGFCLYQYDDHLVLIIIDQIASYRAIKYLDQVQNLYFALTGEELQITL